ncbi:MAG: alpha/beta hydrolase [Sphingomonadales bacterium]|nr:alpha/beta hydrolase [Sphingomonadales bacterium]
MPTYRDPDIIAFRAFWKQAVPNGYAGLEPVDRYRETFDAQNAAIPPAPGCTVEMVQFGGCKAERLTPAGGGGNGILLYLHGGGHVFGSALSHRHMVSRLTDAANMIAYVPDYRLAPENPYPAGLDDAGAVYAALRQAHPGVAIAVAGESAGGNLAAALVVRLLQEKSALPSCVYLLSPWLDLTQSGVSMTAPAIDDLMISRQSLEDCAAYYATDRDRTDPRISPLFGDVTDFPPLLIQVSSDEVLLSDALRLAENVALASGAVDLQCWPEMVHAWPLFHPMISQGREAITQAAAWLAAKCVR